MKGSLFINKFFPLLILYVLIVICSGDPLKGDGLRYYHYAENILDGAYTNTEDPNLRNGPGLPILIALFIGLNIPAHIMVFVNVLFCLGAVYFMFLLIRDLTSTRTAIWATYLFGLYPASLRWMAGIRTESLALFLLVCAIYYVYLLWRNRSFRWSYYIKASLALAWLILTKVLFFHVMLLIGLLYFIGTFLNTNQRYQYTRLSLIMFGALIMVIPYLVYTHSLTGKWMYMGSQGGEILYWRSTPYEGEYGNWFNRNIFRNGLSDPAAKVITIDGKQLLANHGRLYKELEAYSYVQVDSILKKRSIENIKAYPTKYLLNTFSNVTRLIFHYPFSYRVHDLGMFGYFIPNMFIVFIFLFSLYPLIKNIRSIPTFIIFCLLLGLAYLSGIILLGGRGRHFLMAIPSLTVYLSYIFHHLVDIRLDLSAVGKEI